MKGLACFQILVNALISGSTFALVGLGFGLVLHTRRFFHMAHGGLVTLAAYGAWALLALCRLPPAWAMGAGVVAAGLVGAGLDQWIYHPLRVRQAGPTILLVSSLGVLIVLQNLVALAFGDDVRVLRQGAVGEGLGLWGGARITRVQLVTLAVSASSWLLAWLFLKGTRLGRAIRAVGSDPELAWILGIPVERLSRVVFFVGSALGGIAGVLLAYDVGLTPAIGFNALLLGVVIVVVGGPGSLGGIAPAALLVGVTRELAGWWLPTQWQDASLFGVLVAFLLLRSHGQGTRGQARWRE